MLIVESVESSWRSLIELIVPWFHADRKQWPDVEDPALEHPMSPRLVQIQQVYARLRDDIGRVQPLLKPARLACSSGAR